MTTEELDRTIASVVEHRGEFYLGVDAYDVRSRLPEPKPSIGRVRSSLGRLTSRGLLVSYVRSEFGIKRTHYRWAASEPRRVR